MFAIGVVGDQPGHLGQIAIGRVGVELGRRRPDGVEVLAVVVHGLEPAQRNPNALHRVGRRSDRATQTAVEIG